MDTVDLSDVGAEERAKAAGIAERAGVDLAHCYQCGKCSAGCPMAEDMDLPPRRIIRMLQLDLVEQVLKARSPWICAQCSTCSSRCPQNIEIADLMREVRRASHEEGRAVVPESEKFETAFIDGIRSRGRSNEQYLAARYNIVSGHLTQDLTNAPKMLSRGLIGIRPHSAQDTRDIRDLVDRCEPKAGGQDGE